MYGVQLGLLLCIKEMPGNQSSSASTDPFNMIFRALIGFCLVSSLSAVTLAICQEYCASVNGGPNYLNCSPWLSFATNANQTCYNLCVYNCAAVWDGACMTGSRFKCCLDTTPTKTQEYKRSGCNRLYENLP